MAKPKAEAELVKVTYRVEPAQAEALRVEAIKRAGAAGRMKADASEVLRELLAR